MSGSLAGFLAVGLSFEQGYFYPDAGAGRERVLAHAPTQAARCQDCVTLMLRGR